MKHSQLLWAALLGGTLTNPAFSQMILPSDGLRGDFFGYSVDVSTGQAIVGAPFHDENGISSGAAYIYGLSAGPFEHAEMTKLTPPTDSDGVCFGISVAIDDVLAAVGSPGANVVGSGPGKVHLFIDEGVWKADEVLSGNPGSDRDRFGEAVDLEGKWLAVGAPRDDERGTDAGAVYLYRRNGKGWQLRQKIFAPSTGPGDSFGFALDLDGQRLAVGAYQNDLGTTNAGAAYVFLRSGGTWSIESTLLHPDPDLNDHLGRSVDLSGDLLIAGTPEDDDMGSQAGAALVWRREGTVWGLVAELRASDGAAGDSFGHSVCVGPEGRLLVSAPNDDDFGYSSGGVYLYEPSGTGWNAALKHPFGEPAPGDYLGLDMSYDGQYGMVGLMFNDTLDIDAGAAMGLEAGEFPSDWAVAGCFCDTGPCGNDDGSAGCSNSTGQGAVLQANGSNSVGADDLLLTASPLPAQQPAYLLMGADSVSVFLRDGLRCVDGGGGSLYGFTAVSDSSGSLTYGPGLVGTSSGFGSGGTILAGATWNFQVWYRDLAGPCGQGTNLSSSVLVTFAP